MATACYVRISTGGQSTASQKREIERWIKGHRIRSVQWFVDAKSGDHLDRPAFRRLQAAVFNGEIDTVVVYKLDRIARTMQDGINTLCDWCKAGVRLVCVSQQLDFSGPMGKAMAAVAFAFAELEQATRRERQSAGIAAIMANPKLRREKYVGRAGKADGHYRKAKVTDVCRLAAKGLSAAEIGNALGIGRATVYRYLASGA